MGDYVLFRIETKFLESYVTTGGLGVTGGLVF
jgi:hypothetical protein